MWSGYDPPKAQSPKPKAQSPLHLLLSALPDARRRLNLTTAGAVLSVVTAFGLAVTTVAGSLVDRIGSKQLLVASQVICAVGYAGLLVVPESVPLLLLTAGLITIGESVFWVGYPNLVSQIANEEDGDRYLALFALVWTVAGIFSPTLVSLLLSVDGILLWAGMAVAASLTGVIALISERSIGPDVQRTPARA